MATQSARTPFGGCAPSCPARARRQRGQQAAVPDAAGADDGPGPVPLVLPAGRRRSRRRRGFVAL